MIVECVNVGILYTRSKWRRRLPRPAEFSIEIDHWALLKLAAPAILAGGMLFSGTAAAGQVYFNGFETDTAGWMSPTRVASGTGGIASSDGGFHATTAASSGDFTRWGGYNFGAAALPTPFQENSTSLDIFLDVNSGWVNNTRFDFSSAINNAAGSHLSDFIFNAGFYYDDNGPGAKLPVSLSAPAPTASQEVHLPRIPIVIQSRSRPAGGTPSIIASMTMAARSPLT
ncbi:MAG: hypothetical protein ACXW3B_11590 [Telluria sp.]